MAGERLETEQVVFPLQHLLDFFHTHPDSGPPELASFGDAFSGPAADWTKDLAGAKPTGGFAEGGSVCSRGGTAGRSGAERSGIGVRRL